MHALSLEGHGFSLLSELPACLIVLFQATLAGSTLVHTASAEVEIKFVMLHSRSEYERLLGAGVFFESLETGVAPVGNHMPCVHPFLAVLESRLEV